MKKSLVAYGSIDFNIGNFRHKCNVEYSVSEVLESREDRDRIKDESYSVIRGDKRVYKSDRKKHENDSDSADSGGKLILGKRGYEKTHRNKHSANKQVRYRVTDKHRKLKLCIGNKEEEVGAGFCLVFNKIKI